jgi:hypothetical protein
MCGGCCSLLLLLIVSVFRCVLELHAIASKKAEGGGRFAVAMTAQENDRFLRGIQTSDYFEQYYMMLGRVDAEASNCSRATDRESIHESIRRSVGFAKLNRTVFGVMEGWMEEQLREQVAASTANGNDHEAMVWNSVSAKLFRLQGRHNEEVISLEAELRMRQRTLAEDNPYICATRCWLFH